MVLLAVVLEAYSQAAWFMAFLIFFCPSSLVLLTRSHTNFYEHAEIYLYLSS